MKKQMFKDVLEEMEQVYIAKNNDYGDSFGDLYCEYGLSSVVIRLSDKLNRLKTLEKGVPAQVAESIQDTLLDIANYAVMALTEERLYEGYNCRPDAEEQLAQNIVEAEKPVITSEDANHMTVAALEELLDSGRVVPSPELRKRLTEMKQLEQRVRDHFAATYWNK